MTTRTVPPAPSPSDSPAASPPPHAHPVFPDKKQGQLDWRAAAAHLAATQQLTEHASSTQTRAQINFEGIDGPIAVVYSADWHLGSLGVNYWRFREDIEFLLRVPGFYLGTVGDLKDNFHSFRVASAVLQQGLPPKLQNQMLFDLTRELVEADKLLWTVWDNHATEFDERVIGYDAAAYIW